ncbi:YhdP family protein [Marinospirillum alkaliphilum]|uniref:TIGR02099 family protein n=1 Tax=Marinospirillum alkaliphilum DSM 21637 TaxID=1122209 RepID=A0A1K1YWF7_9GAMM|nr:YhdP family protein [Marinospirillum alkaliphilum]SFX66200.1 TIGR02099 family protein [Marinospirillum alkaliphilum DSM 21637]
MANRSEFSSLRLFLLQLPLWSLLVLLVTAALLVLLLRFFMPFLSQLRPDVESYLNARLPFEVETSQLQGSLFRIDPAVQMHELVLSRNGQTFLSLQQARLELDTLASLMALAPRMKDARLSGLEVWLEETEDGWTLAGWQDDPQDASEQSEADVGPATTLRQVLTSVEQLLVQGELDFSDLQLHFTPLEGERLTFSAEALNYRRWSGGRQLAFEVDVAAEATHPARLVITLEGDTFDPRRSTLDAWLSLPQVSLRDFRTLWPAAWQTRFEGMQGQVSMEGWLSMRQGNAKADLQIRDLALYLDDQYEARMDQLAITLQGDPRRWTADWRINQLHSGSYHFEVLQGRTAKRRSAYTLQVSELSLSQLVPALQQDTRLPNGFRELLGDLNPSGVLQDITLHFPTTEVFKLTANLQDVGVAAWHGAPLGQGLHGWLQADARGGQVVFADHSLHLGFPMLYENPWDFSEASGDVRWELEGEEIWVIGEQLSVTLPLNEQAPPTRVTGSFSFYMGEEDRRFYLNLGMLPTNLTAHTQLIPGRLLPSVLSEWLDLSLQSGQVERGGFIYAGSVVSGQPETFQFLGDFSKTLFRFDPRWPELEEAQGWVLVHDASVSGQVNAARMGTARLDRAVFSTREAEGTLLLDVATGLETELAFFPWLVDRSPLDEAVPEALQEWQYSGQARGELALVIPLDENTDALAVSLRSNVRDGRLLIHQVGLEITGIRGPLNFDLDRGLHSPHLFGQVLDSTVQAVIQAEPASRLEFALRPGVDALLGWQQLPELDWLQGRVQVQGALEMNPFRRLILESDLKEVVLTDNFPWPKAAGVELPVRAELDFADDRLPLSIALASLARFRADLNLPEQGMHLRIAEQDVEAAEVPGTPGLTLDMALRYLDASRVWRWLQHTRHGLMGDDLADASTDGQLPETGVKLNVASLDIEDLYWDQLALGEVSMTAELLPLGTRLLFASRYTDGQLWWPSREGDVAELLIGRLYLPAPDTAEATSPQSAASVSRRQLLQPVVDPLAGYDPSGWPNIYLQVDDLKLGERKLGRWNAQLRTSEGVVRADPVYGELGQTSMNATLSWYFSQPQPSSEISGSLRGRNIAPALQGLTGDASPLVSGRHQLDYDFSWSGSPAAFRLDTLAGEFNLRLNDGHFPKTDDRLRGVSRFFGLLNMDTLLRRLRLDFSDVTARGVSYESIRGEYTLEAGYLRTTSPTRIESSATRITLSGEVDLIDETLDQQLTLVLPVAQSLPLAAILVGAPQVGAGIWVVQKLFGNLFDTFTEARYKVSGPLADPKFELQRVF